MEKKISHLELLKAGKDNIRAAAIAKLKYVNNCEEGIKRIKAGKSFKYTYKGKAVKDKTILERIKKLAIPPSWVNVWICSASNGHIQATGFDLRGRKQYRYHAEWNSLRNETKFHRLYEFGKVLTKLRKKIRKDLAQKELTESKVLAAVVKIMEQTYIRIGSNGYEKLYGSYGLTTLKDQHVEIKKDKVLFSFLGKKKISHEIILRDQRLAKIIRQCRDIPGKELFQYYTGDGQRKTIDSGMVNAYIRQAAGSDFSAKDFRTWAGSTKAIECLQHLDRPPTSADTKKNIVSMLDEVSDQLGNTRNICKRYYVHPGLINLYEENKFFSSLERSNHREKNYTGLNAAEKTLMHLLNKSL